MVKVLFLTVFILLVIALIYIETLERNKKYILGFLDSVLIREDGRKYPVLCTEVLIGKSRGSADIVLDAVGLKQEERKLLDGISNYHALLFKDNRDYFISNVSECHYIYLVENGRKTTLQPGKTQKINSGTEINFLPNSKICSLRFERGGDPYELM